MDIRGSFGWDGRVSSQCWYAETTFFMSEPASASARPPNGLPIALTALGNAKMALMNLADDF